MWEYYVADDKSYIGVSKSYVADDYQLRRIY